MLRPSVRIESRILALLATLLLALAPMGSAFAQPEPDGSTPDRAIRLQPGITQRLMVEPGASLWYVAGFGGEPNPFALTAHYLPNNPVTLDPGFVLAINARAGGGNDGTLPRDPGDWPGFVKLGAMSKPSGPAELTPPGTRFWYTNTGRGRDFFVHVVNNTDQRFGLALTNHADVCPVKWSDPPDPRSLVPPGSEENPPEEAPPADLPPESADDGAPY